MRMRIAIRVTQVRRTCTKILAGGDQRDAAERIASTSRGREAPPPEATDGREHVAHGTIRQLTVQ
jgi:hypothetical protein